MKRKESRTTLLAIGVGFCFLAVSLGAPKASPKPPARSSPDEMQSGNAQNHLQGQTVFFWRSIDGLRF